MTLTNSNEIANAVYANVRRFSDTPVFGDLVHCFRVKNGLWRNVIVSIDLSTNLSCKHNQHIPHCAERILPNDDSQFIGACGERVGQIVIAFKSHLLQLYTPQTISMLINTNSLINYRTRSTNKRANTYRAMARVPPRAVTCCATNAKPSLEISLNSLGETTIRYVQWTLSMMCALRGIACILKGCQSQNMLWNRLEFDYAASAAVDACRTYVKRMPERIETIASCWVTRNTRLHNAGR